MKRFIKSLLFIIIGFIIGISIMLYLLGIDPRVWVFGPPTPERLPIAEIAAANGQVESRFTSNGTWRTIARDEVVGTHDELRTGPASYIGTVIRTGGRVVLSEFTHARITGPADELGRIQAVRVRGLTGALRVETDAGLEAPVIVDLAGRAALQEEGGRIVVMENDAGSLLISLMSTGGRLVDKRGNEVRVPADHGLIVAATGGLSQPVELLPPPSPRLKNGAVQVYTGGREEAEAAVRFAESSERIRLILARDPKLLDVITEVEGSGREVVLESLPVGEYYIAAAKRDPETGLVGRFTDVFRLEVEKGDSPAGIDERPGVPVVFTARSSGSVFYTQEPPGIGIDWPGRTTRRTFRVVVASDKKLSKVVQTTSTRGSAYVARNLKAGRYWWQARSSDGRRYTGSFYVRNVKGFVARIERVNQVDEKFSSAKIVYQRNMPAINFTWKPDKRVAGYQLLVASNRGDFDNPVATREVKTTAVKLDAGTLTDGTYKWRVERKLGGGETLYDGKVRELILRFDNSVPSLEITSPADGAKVGSSSVKVEGLSARDATLTVNGTRVSVDEQGRFSASVPVRRSSPHLVFRLVKSGGYLSYYTRELDR